MESKVDQKEQSIEESIQDESSMGAGEPNEEGKAAPMFLRRASKQDRLAFVIGEFFKRSEEGKKLLEKKEDRNLLADITDKSGKRLAAKFAMSGSPISIQIKKDVFITLDRYKTGKIYQITREGDVWESLPIHAVNEKDKSIVLKVYLGRQLSRTVKDFKTLLKILEEQAKKSNIDLKRPKPHLEELERAIRVYDLVQEKKSKNVDALESIAREIFGEDGINEVRMVRHDLDSALNMINGGWRKLLQWAPDKY